LKKIYLYILILLQIIIFSDCAKMGSLTGGPRDEDPPKLVSSIPENYSLNFDGEKIEIEFDEYIQLENVNQELVVSPPIDGRPDVRLKNKSILIEIEDTLRPNTTYTLNFGGAIKDNNEGNPLTNFEFVFSTGDYLDSLSVSGRLLNAFDLKPSEEPVMIMLYDNIYDSVVMKEIPVYIGKTSEDGNFRINNLKADTFKLFALKDANNNFLFDLPNEQIAFADTTVILDPEFFKEILERDKGSIKVDSTIQHSYADTLPAPIMRERGIQPDTAMAANDSLIMRKQPPAAVYVDLFLFEEKSESQYITDYNRKVKNKLEFSFNIPVADSFSFRTLEPEGREDWYMKEITSDRDSFGLWVVDPNVSSMDTISLEMNYTVKDSMNRFVPKIDTLLFTFRFDDDNTKTKTKKSKEDAELMNVSGLKNNATIDLNEKLVLISETPVNYIDTSLVEFYKQVDTLEVAEEIDIVKDSGHIRKIRIIKDWEAEAKYRFVAYPGAFMDVYGATTDTLDARFSVREEGYYGTLIVNPDTVLMPLVIQLMDTREKVLREKKIIEKQEIRFPFLKPSNYRIKIIYDSNGNGKWDTGKYIRKIQPEKVKYYPGDIEVRANWEMAIKLNTLDTDSPKANVKEGSGPPSRTGGMF